MRFKRASNLAFWLSENAFSLIVAWDNTTLSAATVGFGEG
tara:strand:+ start:131 stop:250 length:120 start_codon:yes stop_codon:yes gene_type:complete